MGTFLKRGALRARPTIVPKCFATHIYRAGFRPPRYHDTFNLNRRIILLNHVMIGTNDIERSKQFYDAVLGLLGAGEAARNVAASGHTRLFYRHDGSTFIVSEPINDEPATAANGGTVGFKCASPEQVQEFHDVAIAHGGQSVEAPPGPRDTPAGAVWLSYVRDPDGNKLCGLYRPKA
jgi:catechol 2,3-dioxygenase-like lactoylglutathione lyase family enzyme